MEPKVDWTPDDERELRGALAKRQHCVRLLLARGWQIEELLQDVRYRVWLALSRWDPSRGVSREKWFAWRVGYALQDLLRKSCKHPYL